jgi:hypothetical protein
MVMALTGKVEALTRLVEALTKPWYLRILLILAENQKGQLAYVALILIAFAAMLNGMAFTGWGISVAAETAKTALDAPLGAP